MPRKRLKKNLYYGSNGYIYYSKMFRGIRKVLPTGTKDCNIANKLHSDLEFQVLKEIHNRNVMKFIPFKDLVGLYLGEKHCWSESSRDMTERSLKQYVKNGLPANKNSAAIYKNRVNMCINWGLRNNIKTDQEKFIKTKGSARTRVFSDSELKKILNRIEPDSFQRFIRFAYYTGARRGEIASLTKDSVNNGTLVVSGKTGQRRLKLIPQALDNMDEFNYSPDFVTKKFKKELIRLNIEGRFHDLRRTFGLNCMRKGLPIQEISKLLGHSNIQVTLDHYAPFSVEDIKDFTL